MPTPDSHHVHAGLIYQCRECTAIYNSEQSAEQCREICIAEDRAARRR